MEAYDAVRRSSDPGRGAGLTVAQAINAGLRIRSVDGKTPRIATHEGVVDNDGEESSSSDEDEDRTDAAGQDRHAVGHSRGASSASSMSMGDHASPSDKARRQREKVRSLVVRLHPLMRSQGQARTEQRGMHHSKAVRSLAWIKTGAKERASKIRHSLDMKARQPEAIESEVRAACVPDPDVDGLSLVRRCERCHCQNSLMHPIHLRDREASLARCGPSTVCRDKHELAVALHGHLHADDVTTLTISVAIAPGTLRTT
jgi:hypothetical protein